MRLGGCVTSLWTSRLAEVWASPGHAGAGVVVGLEGVLTARHVVADALADAGGRILARVVRAGEETVSWVPTRCLWNDRGWDLALLAVDHELPESAAWATPGGSSEPVVVQLGGSAEAGCEAVGFPAMAVQHATGDPSENVRQPEQAVGTVAPSAVGKRPRNPERAMPPRLMPLDVTDTSLPETQAGWSGMSGAGVVLPAGDDRLIGIVVIAAVDRQQKRLYLVPLADALGANPALAQRLAELAGGTQVVEVRDAPLYRHVCQTGSLGPDGLPRRVGEISGLDVFGVKPADVPGEPTYLNYVPRDDDNSLREALREAIGARRMLLVVGGSAAGKSRSTAEAVRDQLPRHRLIRPHSEMLAAVCDLALAELGPAIVWLDDVQQYAHQASGDTLERLLQAGLVVTGTIRRAELDMLAPAGDVRNPAGEALTDATLVQTLSWRLEWTPQEQARLAERASYPPLLEAAAKGTSPGAYVVAGPLLVRRLNDAQVDEEHPCNYALVRTVLDWYRTGITQPIPIDEAIALLHARVNGNLAPDQDEIDDALKWAVHAVIGAGRRTRQSLVTREKAEALVINDYLIDHDQRQPGNVVPNAVWQAALHSATTDATQTEQLWRVGLAAYDQQQPEVALSAMQVLADLGQAPAMFNTGVLLGELGRSEEEIAVYDELLARFGEAPEPALREQVANALLNKGVRLGALDRSEEAVAVYDDVVGRFGEAPEPALREQVAEALVYKGVRLGAVERLEEEIAVYDELLARFGEAPEPALREQVANALLNKGLTLGALERLEEEIAVYDDVVGRFGEAPEPALRERVANALLNKGLTLDALERLEEEIAVYDDVVGRFGEAPEPALREPVAKALLNKGVRLGALDRLEEEIAVYDDVVARFGEAPEPALRERVAKALVNKGVRLGAVERLEEAVAVYDELLARFGEAPEPALREQVAKALLNKGLTLGALDRSEEAVAVYDDVVARFGEAPEPALREQVANALFNKGLRLGAVDRLEEEIAVYDDVVARFGEAPEPALRERVANALFNKGVRLGALDRSEEAVAVYDDVVARFGEAPEPALREQVAKALFNKGVRLGDLDRSEEEIVVYDDVVGRFGEAPEPALREPVANALFNKGVRLGDLDRLEEEIAVYDELLARFGEAPEPALREQVAQALVYKGVTLGALNRSEEAVAVYDELLARFGEAPEPALREQVANALANMGIAAAALGHFAEAAAVYHDVVARFGEAPEPALRVQVANALVNKGIAEAALGLSEEELTLFDDVDGVPTELLSAPISSYDEVVARFGEAPEPALREQVANALFNKGVTLGQLGRSEDAVFVYDELLAQFADAPEPAIGELIEIARTARSHLDRR